MTRGIRAIVAARARSAPVPTARAKEIVLSCRSARSESGNYGARVHSVERRNDDDGMYPARNETGNLRIEHGRKHRGLTFARKRYYRTFGTRAPISEVDSTSEIATIIIIGDISSSPLGDPIEPVRFNLLFHANPRIIISAITVRRSSGSAAGCRGPGSSGGSRKTRRPEKNPMEISGDRSHGSEPSVFDCFRLP